MNAEDIKDRDDALAFWNDMFSKEVETFAGELSDKISDSIGPILLSAFAGKLNCKSSINNLLEDAGFQDWISAFSHELCLKMAEADLTEKYKP